MSAWSWRKSPELIHRLLKAQISLAQPVDIITAAANCHTRQELSEHVEDCELQVERQRRNGDQRRLAATLFLALQDSR